VAFAIVLLTPDDVGRVANADAATDQPRARQNVVFELGYFFGKLGRDHVAVINSGVEKPSDVDGLAYIAYPAGNWQIDLAKELHGAGIPVDMARLL
jgi:predicted nucleotide-binding protein